MVKKALPLVTAMFLVPVASVVTTTLENDRVAVRLDNRADALWTLVLGAGGPEQPVAPPVFEIGGNPVPDVFPSPDVSEPRGLANGAVEHVVSGPLAGDPALEMRLALRLAPASPIVRFRVCNRNDLSRGVPDVKGGCL